MQANLKSNTAILLFANSARKDSCLKKMEAGEALFEKLTDKTLRTIRATGLPFFHVSEKEQYGTSFGERFSNAIQHVFDLGYTQVITLGNDSPRLTAKHILEAQTRISQHQNVLGPATDGGMYLMGIHRLAFDKESFASLPWQNSSLYRNTKAYFETRSGSVHSLNRLNDIDSIADVKHLSNHIQSLGHSLMLLFSKVLESKNRILSIHQDNFTSPSHIVLFNKGSPTYFSSL